MTSARTCVICQEPLDDASKSSRRRRADSRTCSKSCRTALWRQRKNAELLGLSVTSDTYEPPASDPHLGRSYSHDVFHNQWSRDERAQAPKSQRQLDLEARQRRNPGPLDPELAEIYMAHEIAQERLEQEAIERAQDGAYSPEDPLVAASRGSMTRRAQLDRGTTKRASRWMRPGHDPEAPQVIDMPYGRNTPRHLL